MSAWSVFGENSSCLAHSYLLTVSSHGGSSLMSLPIKAPIL